MILKKGIFDYPFSFDISSAEAGTTQYLGYATAGEGTAVDSVESKVPPAADCAPVEADRAAPTTGISLDRRLEPQRGGCAHHLLLERGRSRQRGKRQDPRGQGRHRSAHHSGQRGCGGRRAGLAQHGRQRVLHLYGHRAGVPASGCTPGTPVVNEGADQSVHGAGTDNVGKTANMKVGGINIDKTSPTLTAVRKTSPNAAGWNNGDVTVSRTGVDPLSGIDPASRPSDSVVTGEGATSERRRPSGTGQATPGPARSRATRLTGPSPRSAAPS